MTGGTIERDPTDANRRGRGDLDPASKGQGSGLPAASNKNAVLERSSIL